MRASPMASGHALFRCAGVVFFSARGYEAAGTDRHLGTMTASRPESSGSPLRLRDRGRECTVVIPVYNSEATLPALTERLAATLPGVADRFEVVLVNDGSRDDSWDAICQAARKYPWIRGINLMRNYGQHSALLAGIRAARYEVIVTMDDDLEHPPDQLGLLIEKLAEGREPTPPTP